MDEVERAFVHVDYEMRVEPEHKVERNLREGNRNLMKSHPSVRVRTTVCCTFITAPYCLPVCRFRAQTSKSDDCGLQRLTGVCMSWWFIQRAPD